MTSCILHHNRFPSMHFFCGLAAVVGLGKNYESIRRSLTEHLRHFLHQIHSAEEICMEASVTGYPRTLINWVKKATDLKNEVSKALKEKNDNKDPAIMNKKQKKLRKKIVARMKKCPVENVNDKLFAWMHETDYKDESDGSVLIREDVGSSDQSEHETASSSDSGLSERTIRSKQENMSTEDEAESSASAMTEDSASSSEAESSASAMGESSYAHDTSQDQDGNNFEVMEECYARSEKRINTVLKQLNVPQRRLDERLNDGSPDTSNAVSCPELRVPASGMNPHQQQIKTKSSYEEKKDQVGTVIRPISADQSSVTTVDESQQGMIIPILVTGKMSEYVDLRLEILRISCSQVTSNLNSVFGLNQDEDKYLFSDKERHETSYSTGPPLLPEDLLVNKSGSQSKEIPTADEWKQACVVNLIDKILLMPSEEPDCPNLVLLFLQRNGRLTQIPTSFFNKMPALRFLDLSDTRIKALPSSLFELSKLQVLLLRNCACLDNLPADIQKLANMEVLDFLGTDLDLPKQIGILTQLKYLQLSFNRPDYGSEYDDFQPELVRSGALSALQDLQALSIEVHPKDHYYWIKTVRGMIQQVSELMKLRYLQFYFPTVEDLNSFTGISLWKEERLKRFNFIVGHNIKRIISRVSDEVESIYEQHERCLRFINGSEVPEVMKSILRAVTAFYLDHHSKIKSLSEFNISTFQELKFCIIRECCDMQVMINETNSESAFPNLNYLGLHYLWNLERIWVDTIPSGSFQALEYMRVSTCGKLQYIASHRILQYLSNLEKLIIEDCESLESIVKERRVVKRETTLLPRLKELVLRHLPKLVTLGSGLSTKKITHFEFCPNLIHEPVHSRIDWKRLLSSSCNCFNTYNSTHT